jgi:hypothetical protein
MDPLRRRRWLIAGAVVAGVAALPAVVAALPARSSSLNSAELLRRVAASEPVGYSGYAEASSRLGLPDVPRVGRAVNLLSETSRLRVWWNAPDRWRVDHLSLIGERDTYHQPEGTWVWDGDERRATVLRAEPAVRLVRAPDLIPPELGRRLARATSPGEARRIAARRVAGRSAAGVRLTPRAADTTVDHVDLYVEPRTGLPVQVRVFAHGSTAPVIDTAFLDLSLRRPSERVATFVPPLDAEVDEIEGPDVASYLARISPYAVPEILAGRRLRESDIDTAGTYGRGFSLVAVVPLPQDQLFRLRRRLGETSAHRIGGQPAVKVETSLVNAVAFVTADGAAAWLITGTVPLATLDEVARDLARAELRTNDGGIVLTPAGS